VTKGFTAEVDDLERDPVGLHWIQPWVQTLGITDAHFALFLHPTNLSVQCTPPRSPPRSNSSTRPARCWMSGTALTVTPSAGTAYAGSGQAVMHAHLHILVRYADEPHAGKGIRWFYRQADNRRPSPNAPGAGAACAD